MTASPPQGNGNVTAISENTPLLATSADDPFEPVNEGFIIRKASRNDAHADTTHQDVGDKPLPKKQIFLLCFARMIEPIAFFGIFPFINKMIQETGNLDMADVGFYSGLIESLFSLTQMSLMISWGRAADRIGRKPVLVFSLIGVAISTAIFGLSKRIWQMILFRCCAGVFAGTIVTVRAMISENSTTKTQARAFSFFAFSGNLGILLGPLIGGALSNPAEQYGGIFKKIRFISNFPYALSTFTTGSIAAIAAIICALFVKETLKRKAKGDDTPLEAPMSIWEIIKAPGVRPVLFIYGHVMLLGVTYTAGMSILIVTACNFLMCKYLVCPTFWFTEPQLGGYGFTPMQISLFLAVIGISQATWLLIFFPIIQRKYGTGAVLRICLYVWPLFFIAAPLCNEILRRDYYVAFWIIAPILQISGSGVSMAFTGVQLALNDISPSPSTLGTLNAIALTMTSALRAIGPEVVNSLFAWGANTQFMDGHLVWVFLTALALAGSVAVRWLPEKAEGKLKEDDDEDE